MLSHEWPFGVDQIRSSIFTKRECIYGYNNRLYCTILCDAVESVFEHSSFTEILWQATLKSINDDIRFVCKELVIQKHVKYVKYDIITGWLTKDGEVKSITINKDKKFSSEQEYKPTAKVVITYHTWRKNKPKQKNRYFM